MYLTKFILGCFMGNDSEFLTDLFQNYQQVKCKDITYRKPEANEMKFINRAGKAAKFGAIFGSCSFFLISIVVMLCCVICYDGSEAQKVTAGIGSAFFVALMFIAIRYLVKWKKYKAKLSKQVVDGRIVSKYIEGDNLKNMIYHALIAIDNTNYTVDTQCLKVEFERIKPGERVVAVRLDEKTAISFLVNDSSLV